MKSVRPFFGAVLLSAWIGGCSGSSTSPSTISPGASLTLSGQLLSAALFESLGSSFEPTKVIRDNSLSGASMLCATLTSPPVSGTGTSNSSGNVSVTFNGASQPFNCTLTAAGSANSVPIVLSSGATTGAMAVASSDLSLGTISVTTNGNGTVVAGATLPASAQLQTTTPAGLSCLAGTWSFTSAVETCNGAATSYNLFFAPLPDGTYSSSFVQMNGVTNTLRLTGSTTNGSNCITVNSTAGLAVGQAVTDVESWTINPGGQGIIPSPGTTITSLTACGGGQIQLSQNATATEASDSFLVTVCGTTARNTKNVAYSATNSTVSMTYPQACHDVPVAKLIGVFGSSSNGVGFTADLTPGSQCISNLKLPGVVSGTTVLAAGNQVTDADFSDHYFPTAGSPKVSAVPGTCGAGNFQMTENSSATGTTLLTAYNLPGITSFNFYGSMTTGSPCVSPVLPGAGALSGYYVGDSAAAISAAAGAGVTLVPATGGCTGSYMLSEAAGSKATTGETIVIVPASVIASNWVCEFGTACFDKHGNAYTGVTTCPSGTAALTAQTAVDTYPINASCTRLWASQTPDCYSAFDMDASLGNHCGTGSNTTNTPVSAVRQRYAQTNTGCAACFPATGMGIPTDYPVNGCVGYGNVTCSANNNGSNSGSNSNVVVTKQ